MTTPGSWSLLHQVAPVVVALSVSPPAAPPALERAVRSEMERWRSPGAAVAVLRDGRELLVAGYGMASRERSKPVTVTTLFHIGSMTKQFTAAAVMLLVQDGRVVLDERAARYLPGLPPAYAAITVRQVLQHTSGIGRDFKEGGDSLIGAALYARLAATPPSAAPGEQAAYSNTEYILLGMLIEAVTGQEYGEFLRARIFAPLGMSGTRYVRPGDRPDDVATGYEWDGGSLRPIDAVPARFAAGGLVSSVRDLARWDAALGDERLLRRTSLEALWTAAQLNDGSPAIIGSDDAGRLLGAAMGWHLSIDLGHRVVHHGGNIDGYSSQIDRFVDDKVTVIVLANNEAHAAMNISRALVARYVPELDRASGPSLAQQGRVAYDAEDFAAAARLFDAALEAGDATPRTAFAAARSFARLGRRSEGLAYLERAAALGFRDVDRLATETSLDLLRSDPRWPGIVERVAANRARGRRP